MKNEYLRDEGNALRIQNDQLIKGVKKLSEIDHALSEIQKEQDENDILLDSMLNAMESLLDDQRITASENAFNKSLEELESELDNIDHHSKVTSVSELDNITLEDDDSWDDYLKKVEDYANKHNIDLQEDPFKHLMTKTQQIELQKRINEEFTFKNANCDGYDYLIAGTCGVIGGLIDVLFVGIPGESKLGSIADESVNKITETFASFLGWDKNKAIERGSNTTASAIGFLERKFKINYDQATTSETGGAVQNLSMKNHHLKNLAHSPDLIGLFFSILNQFTSTSTFISGGKIITIDTQTFELQGANFIAKIFCGFANWFGHIMSDWSGSSGSAGQGHRGTGVPIPFYNLLQLGNFGRFGEKDRETFAIITSKVFEQGYDLRHGMAMAVPVVITELLIRFMYTMKAHFYHEKDWQESIPDSNIPELRRMLLVGHGVLCLIDGCDAFVRSGGDMVSFLLRTNYLGWIRFGHLGLKELNAWYNAGHIDCDAVDEYLEKEYSRMLAQCST
jgi:hypothetical protein